MANSTWEVTQTDNSAEDVPLFHHAFRAIESAAVTTTPLAPFDRAAAQRWWDGNAPKDADKSAAPKAAAAVNP